MICPDCGRPTVVVSNDWRSFMHLAGQQLDGQVVVAGLHAQDDPTVEAWSYFACLTCSAQGVFVVDREAAQP